MEEPLLTSAVRAAIAVSKRLGFEAEDAVLVHNSNRIAVRLVPCNVLARVAAEGDRRHAAFEVDVARRLGAAGCPIAPLEPRAAPRVCVQDRFAVTFWTYYDVGLSSEVAPGDYVRALGRMHDGMRTVTGVPAPHFMDRVVAARRIVGDPQHSPGLGAAGRHLLLETLETLSGVIRLRGAREQLLHGEPHPGNLLVTRDGALFTDLETCCRGPIEFDVAHAPEEVGEQYPGLDRELLRDCRILSLAIATAWRWDRRDQLPNGRSLGVEWLNQLRSALHP